MSREYVSTEFNCHRISVNELAFDSLVLLVCGLSLIPAKRLKECLANCFRFVNDKLVSGKRPATRIPPREFRPMGEIPGAITHSPVLKTFFLHWSLKGLIIFCNELFFSGFVETNFVNLRYTPFVNTLCNCF